MSRGAKVVVGVVVAAGLAAAWINVRPRYNENRRCCGMGVARNVLYSFQEALGRTHSYSQLGQDKWVTEVVFPGVKEGFFVDVGSADGTVGSNSKLLEEYGWRGICIDPFPKNMEGRSCQMFKDVVSNESGQVVSFREAGDIGGIDRSLGAWQKQARQAPATEFTTVTLADILARGRAPRYINYMSLDIEGAELAALQGFPWERFTVGAMTIEHNHEEPKRSNIKVFLESRGYRRSFESITDDYYVPVARQ